MNEQTNPPKLSPKLWKKLLNLAVSYVHVKCIGLLYQNCLAKSASLAVILTKIGLKK